MSLFDDNLLSYDYSGDSWSVPDSSIGVDWGAYDTSEPVSDWWNAYTDYDGGLIDLSNSDYMLDGSLNPNPSPEEGGGWGGTLNSLLGALGGSDSALYNLGSALLGGYDLYNDYDNNKDVKELLANQIYNTENDQYRAYTGQAGEHTQDAYTVGMNNYKGDLMMSLMANDKHLPQADRERLMGGLSQVTDRYAPAFEGYANDMINDRNARYGDRAYNSQAPFTAPYSSDVLPIPTEPAVQTPYTSLGMYSPEQISGAQDWLINNYNETDPTNIHFKAMQEGLSPEQVAELASGASGQSFNQQNVNDYYNLNPNAEYINSIPAGTSPEIIEQYKQYLGAS